MIVIPPGYAIRVGHRALTLLWAGKGEARIYAENCSTEQIQEFVRALMGLKK